MIKHSQFYLLTVVQLLSRQLNIRQRASGTAEVYLTRFFSRISFFEVNAYVMVATCVYVACKTEECPQHIRSITSEAKNLWPDFVSHDPTKIAECEFYLIEELDSYLVVYHPYRSLMQLLDALTTTNNQLTLASEEIQSAWSMINDSYATDMMLLYPPHIIATACLYITLVLRTPSLRPSKPPESIKVRLDLFVHFLGTSGIDLEKVVESIQEIISLYVRWESYDENSCRSLLSNNILTSSS